MANRIAGITVEIGGDTTKISTALKTVNSEIRSTQRRYVEPTTTCNYFYDPKENLAFERCIEVMSRLMMKYGPALLEKMEREKLDALIRAEIEPAADSVRLSKRLLGYCQLMKDRK